MIFLSTPLEINRLVAAAALLRAGRISNEVKTSNGVDGHFGAIVC